MSVWGDAFSAVRQVVLLDDRVTSLATDLAATKAEMHDLARRVARIEGMLEMALFGSRRLGRD